MEIAILYCEDCFFSDRAEAQLSKAFESMVGIDRQKLNLAYQTYDIKEVESHSKATQIHRAKAQIVIISHHFLDRLKHETNLRKKVSPINRILRPKRVIAVLLSVSEELVVESSQEYLLQFSEWYTIELKSSNKLDPEFYKKFTEQIIKIYNLELSNTINFSIFPKKVTRDQPKVVILFKNSLNTTDKVHIELTRGRQREQLGEVMLTNPHTGMIRVPTSLCEDRNCLIEITVFVNNQKLGTKLVKYDHSSKSFEEDMIDKMSSVIPGFRKALDDHISQQLSKNFRSCEDFTLDSSLELMNDALICRGDDFPSAMHFATNYGLEQTVCVLLYEGDGLEQSVMKNDVGETPVDIAQERGFSTIAQTIKDFYEITNTFGALQYIKDLCDRHSEELELLSGENRESSNSTITITKHDDDSNSEIIDVEQEADSTGTTDNQTNPEYQVTNYEQEQFDENEDASGHAYSEISERIECETTNDRVKIEIDSAQNQDEQSGTEVTLGRHSLHLSVPFKTFSQNPGMDYVNVTSAVDRLQKEKFLQSYDTPPAPSPVLAGKPQRKLGSLSQLMIGGNNYDFPRTSTDDYCIPPPFRPIIPHKPNLNTVQPTEPVLSVKSNLLYGPDGYIFVNNGSKDEISSSTIENPMPSRPKPPIKPLRATKPVAIGEDSNSPKYPAVLPPMIQIPPSGLSKLGFLNSTTITPLPLTKQFSLDSTQEELLELMNDFKKNVYNIRELELLYENWKQRNDVQLDFKARQKELKEIQKEYKKIQEKVRRELKKPGPMAKLLKMMPGVKKKQSVPGLELNAQATIIVDPTQGEEPTRKVSGGSDRCSTMSESSIPDSGVSDPDSDKDRLRWSYVGPSELPLGKPDLTTSVNNSSNQTVPVRPPKKPWITSEQLPLLLKKNLQSTLPNDSVEKQVEVAMDSIPPIVPSKKKLDSECSNEDALLPTPPPRVAKVDSPFSYINYKGKSKGLLGMNTLRHDSAAQKGSDDKPIRSTYENQVERKK